MGKIIEQEYFVEKKPATRFDCMERLDRDKYYSNLHGNMVKWWNVSVEEKAAEEEYDPDAAAEELLADALGDTYFEDDNIGIPEGTDEITSEAMEIYNRIQEELASDEAAKQAEIEEAKRSMGV